MASRPGFQQATQSAPELGSGWWSKGDSNCEPLSDAFVNFVPFEGRGDANGDRPERADTLRSTGTTTDSYVSECGRRLYGSLAPRPVYRRDSKPSRRETIALE